jgi:hypothetical protein
MSGRLRHALPPHRHLLARWHSALFSFPCARSPEQRRSAEDTAAAGDGADLPVRWVLLLSLPLFLSPSSMHLCLSPFSLRWLGQSGRMQAQRSAARAPLAVGGGGGGRAWVSIRLSVFLISHCTLSLGLVSLIHPLGDFMVASKSIRGSRSCASRIASRRSNLMDLPHELSCVPIFARFFTNLRGFGRFHRHG